MRKSMKSLLLSLLVAGTLANPLTVQAEELITGRNDTVITEVPSTGGWADFGPGTTGGAEASDEHIFVVTNKKELLEALNGGPNGNHDTSKIIYIKGTIDINVDENNNPVGRDYYADPEYDLDAYLEEYNPENWGWEALSGPLEEARERSQKVQAKEIKLRVGSNTSIIGLGNDARVKGGSFVVSDGVENIIIQNLHIEAPVDFFPEWDPKDGALGDWNSEYDAIQIIDGAHHIWVNHNTLTESTHPDKIGGYMFGRLFMEYDGLVDVTREANYVTISYNIFEDFDKVSLIGGSNNHTDDRDHLKVTIHNNYYKNAMERTPRVRFGEVHVYNNYYEINDDGTYPFEYSWGVGFESKGYYENNYFSTTASVDPARIIKVWQGTSMYESGTYLNGESVDLIELHNAANPDEQIDRNVGWTPTFFNDIIPTPEVPAYVMANAGVQMYSRYAISANNIEINEDVAATINDEQLISLADAKAWLQRDLTSAEIVVSHNVLSEVGVYSATFSVVDEPETSVTVEVVVNALEGKKEEEKPVVPTSPEQPVKEIIRTSDMMNIRAYILLGIISLSIIYLGVHKKKNEII